jgi:hypothetical protein
MVVMGFFHIAMGATAFGRRVNGFVQVAIGHAVGAARSGEEENRSDVRHAHHDQNS